MRTIFAEYNPQCNSIDVYTSADYMLRIDCWKAEKNLKTTPGSDSNDCHIYHYRIFYYKQTAFLLFFHL